MKDKNKYVHICVRCFLFSVVLAHKSMSHLKFHDGWLLCPVICSYGTQVDRKEKAEKNSMRNVSFYLKGIKENKNTS